jgi:methylglutamate dehydrogenase subunit B
MLIPCPHCGVRPHSEFTYGGDATRIRPTNVGAASDEAWLDYVYIRDNRCGRHREFWHHTLGCDRWIHVERDTFTHQVFHARAVGRDAVPGAA